MPPPSSHQAFHLLLHLCLCPAATPPATSNLPLPHHLCLQLPPPPAAHTPPSPAPLPSFLTVSCLSPVSPPAAHHHHFLLPLIPSHRPCFSPSVPSLLTATSSSQPPNSSSPTTFVSSSAISFSSAASSPPHHKTATNHQPLLHRPLPHQTAPKPPPIAITIPLHLPSSAAPSTYPATPPLSRHSLHSSHLHCQPTPASSFPCLPSPSPRHKQQ